MAYANDIFIIGKALASMKEGFQLLEEASNDVELITSKGKTKYVAADNTQKCRKRRAIETGR
jgi:hypothetical protein